MLRVGGILTSVLAAVGLVLLPPPAGGGQAQADSGSAVTQSGTKGQYDDFSSLKVTVEQTENLTSQGVKVSWTGGAPTVRKGDYGIADYLQIMQCWGNEDGPTPEQCEFGQPPPNVGVLNAGRGVSSSNDPLEPSERTIPFTTATGESSTDVAQYFTQFTTNEQDLAFTGTDGTGETIFSLEDDTTSPILGCGASRQDGQAPPPCWLVVVPRGAHEADGSAPNDNIGLEGSALSASNWKQRLQFRLDFRTTDSPCVIGQDEQPTSGSDFAFPAMTSWEPKLCTSEKITYQFTPQLEELSREQIANPDGNAAGLAFLENPVAPQAGSPPVVHAPVAVSGLVIGYNVNVAQTTRQVPRIRLNARLVAKMVTESYECEVPGTGMPRGILNPTNPSELHADPEFQKLNPGTQFGFGSSCGPGISVPQGGSDAAGMLWTWLRSDPDAKAFLEGKADPWGMKINPYFLKLDPAHAARSDFPKPEETEYAPSKQFPDAKVTAVDLNPYTVSLSATAGAVRSGSNGGVANYTFYQNGQPPQANKNARPLPGQSFFLGVTDAASAARYRLGTAELLNADGQFVAPTVDSLTKAVNGMKAGKVPGVLNQNPAAKTSGAYPLTTVTYAAANTSLDATQRAKYATLIRYAVGLGQQPGLDYGQLPPGYAPLTPALHDQALAAATALIAGVVPTSPTGGNDGGSTNGSGSGGATSSGGTNGGTGGTDGGGSGAAGGSGSSGGSPSPTPAAAAGATKGAAGGPSASPPVHNVADSGGTTPGAILGAIRWVLMIVLIAGIAGSLAGPLLMRAGVLHGTGRPFLRFRRSGAT